jgi:hypothetical protein
MSTKKTTKKAAKFDYKDIKSFVDACKKQKIDPTAMPDLSMIPERFRKPMIAFYKLMVGFEAINPKDFPRWDDNSLKYYPYHWVLPSGLGFGASIDDYDYPGTDVGARLCTDSSDKALHMAKYFNQEYEDFKLKKD